jgi:hypothetical protein
MAATLAATTVTATGATLNGTINAAGLNTAVTFDYGTSNAYGTSVGGSPSTVTGGGATAVSATLTNLAPNTTYNFRVNGQNSTGTVSGANMTFTTLTNPATPAPVINSALTANGTAGQAFSYQITASNSPTAYGAAGLPSGLNLNPTTGLINGTPSVSGFFTVSLSASNGGGTASAQLAMTLATASVPEIDLRGSTNVDIASGSASPGTANGTLAPTIYVGDTASLAFQIRNSGAGSLTLGGNPRVSLQGANASQFAVLTLPAAIIASGQSSGFSVAYKPTAAGHHEALVVIANNDSNESSFSFVIAGNAVDRPPQPPATLFTGLTNGGGGWWVSRWFGTMYLASYPTVTHAQHGKIYLTGTSESSLWVKDTRLPGYWYWTSSGKYPKIYLKKTKLWWTYKVGSKNPRLFKDNKTLKWIKVY